MPPKIGMPIMLPSERNSSAVDVAVPRSRCGALFWAASSEGCMIEPTPVPSTEREDGDREIDVSIPTVASSAMPPASPPSR